MRDADFELPADVDLAFIAIHGTFGEDGQVQKILEGRGVAYTGENVEGSRIAFDKILSKEKFEAQRVTTPDWEILTAGQRPSLALPFVIKAPRQGSTVGVHIVKESSMKSTTPWRKQREYDEELLVEKFVPGRELTIGILGDLALPILEIIPKGGFYDFKNKYPFLNPSAGGGAEHICPAPIPDELDAPHSGSRATRASFDRPQVYSRVDIMLPEQGEPTVLELNTIPGMTEVVCCPTRRRAAGIELSASYARGSLSFHCASAPEEMKRTAQTTPRARNQRVSNSRQRRQQHLLDVKVRSRTPTQHRNRRVLVSAFEDFARRARLRGRLSSASARSETALL